MNKITNIKERIMEFANHQLVSYEKFFPEIDMSYASFRGKAKERPINSNAIAILLTKYPELNSHWLLTGIGEMLNSNNESDLTSKYIKPTNDSILPNGAIPFYNLPVSAGHSALDIKGAITPDGYIKDLPGAMGTEAFLPVVGYSMYPEIKEGAIIGVRKMGGWEELNTQNKYLIITKDDRMVKYIEYDHDNSDFLWCTSPNYQKFKIYKESIIEINRVTLVINPQ